MKGIPMAHDRYTYPFENVTTVTIPGTVHQLGTANLEITLCDTE